MRAIDLREHVCSGPWPLSAAERDALRVVPSLVVEPAAGREGAYHLTPGSTVGAVEIGDLSVSIRPKLDVARVLFLAGYAPEAFEVRERFDFREAPTLVEALAPALTAAARRAFAGGLLHGYRAEEEALFTVRGRIRVDEQVRRRFGVGRLARRVRVLREESRARDRAPGGVSDGAGRHEPERHEVASGGRRTP